MTSIARPCCISAEDTGALDYLLYLCLAQVGRVQPLVENIELGVGVGRQELDKKNVAVEQRVQKVNRGRRRCQFAMP